jgi:endonuclease/exonuclease/phosphatase family metal-dependent hydrolase
MRATLLVALALSVASPMPSQAPLRVLTFNIRYGTANDGAHRWPHRSAHVVTTIRDHAPHVLGIQEALRFQLDELARALPGYREFGVGRDDGRTAGEYAAILVDTARFTVVSNGHFWYSDTPAVPSRAWGNLVIRICTWLRLVDRATGDTVRVYNSHWDHESQPSRMRSASALLDRIASDGSSGDAVLVLGDFNADESNAAFQALLHDARVPLRDTYRAVHPAAEFAGTFNAFRGDSTQGKIDAILASPGWTVHAATIDRRRFGPLWASDHFAVSATLTSRAAQARPAFESVQPDVFAAGGALATAWADYDGDGDADLFAGFNGSGNRLYRNDNGVFTNVAAGAGVADARPTRAAAWGDYDADGDADLLVGFAPGAAGPVLKLYRNDRGAFTDVTTAARLVADSGAVRQPAWIDYDADGDVDLFVAFRDRSNALFRNDGGRFSNVTVEAGLVDSARSVGATWFDYDADGDLDVIVANMDGDANALYSNARGRFTRVRGDFDAGGRAIGDASMGSVRPCVADVDGDGRFDLFFANYGRNGLLLNRGNGRFEDVSTQWGATAEGRYDTCTFDDFDNDGRLDLYVNGTVGGNVSYRDYLYRNEGSRFADVTPANVAELHASHGAHWIDFDRDGGADLALAGSRADAKHALLRNLLAPTGASRSLAVTVTDVRGHQTRAGAEVRVYAAGTRRLLGTRLVDAGSGYNAQNQVPVRFGVPDASPVDVEVTFLTGSARTVVRVERVDPAAHRGSALVVREGQGREPGAAR